MIKRENELSQLSLALYLLKSRFHTPIDLVKYWAFSGPCTEKHPPIEKLSGDVENI